MQTIIMNSVSCAPLESYSKASDNTFFGTKKFENHVKPKTAITHTRASIIHKWACPKHSNIMRLCTHNTSKWDQKFFFVIPKIERPRYSNALLYLTSFWRGFPILVFSKKFHIQPK